MSWLSIETLNNISSAGKMLPHTVGHIEDRPSNPKHHQRAETLQRPELDHQRDWYDVILFTRAGRREVRRHRVVGLAEDMAHTLYLTPNGMLRPTPHNVNIYDESRTHSARSLCKNSSSRSLRSAIRSDNKPDPSRLP